MALKADALLALLQALTPAQRALPLLADCCDCLGIGDGLRAGVRVWLELSVDGEEGLLLSSHKGGV